MKNLLSLTAVAYLLIMSACTRSSSTTPTTVTPTPTPTPTSPYYFKFTMAGITHNFTANIPQYMPFYANEAGGYEVADGNLFPSAGLRLSWPLNDTVKESDLMGLIGKTLHYNDTLVHPEVSYTTAASADAWLSVDTASTAYSVTIINITYLKKDTSAGYPVKTYVLTGTCNAVMQQGSSTNVLSGGSFSFIISRRDL